MILTGLAPLTILWFVIAAAFISWRWKVDRGVGLVVFIVLAITAIHGLAAVLYLLPWYDKLDTDLVTSGFRAAFQALCAFCIGVGVASRRFGPPASAGRTYVGRSADGLGWTYLVIGLVMYGVLSPRLARIPSLGAVVATGSNYVVLGICLRCWSADNARVARWFGVSMLLPFVTILTQGFLGYGLAAFATVGAFVAETTKSKKTLLLAGLLMTYVTMSFFVTYMRDRASIRDAVWSGAETSRRVDLLAGSLATFEFFNPYNPDHLWRVDERLNQDHLVGLAMYRLDNGVVPYGGGETVKDAFVALLPRAFWPEKGVVAGSSDIVSRYTGLRFSEGTSVGVGLVMELLVNFGAPGVWIGFILFGALIVFIDERAHYHLIAGDGPRFALWFLPGTSLLQLCVGSLVDGSASAGAALVSVFLVNAAIIGTISRRPRPEGTNWAGPRAESEPVA